MKSKIIALVIFTCFSIVGFSQIDSEQPQVAKAKIGSQIGNLAPNISLPNPDGTFIDLYSLRGQVVLLDFWASWCGPCRMENPNLVKTYNEYTDKNFTIGKGFTIYSVSIDNNKANWLTAIQRDNLLWKAHVNDSQGWYSSYIMMYKVQGIPSNFLIDENGIIIATNLRGQQLDNVLKQFVK